MHDTSQAVVAGGYPPVPSPLVDTSALQQFLNSLLGEVRGELDSMKRCVEASRVEMVSAGESFNIIKRFMTSQTLSQLEALTTASDMSDVDADFQHIFKDVGINDSGDASHENEDLFSRVMATSRKLMADNTRMTSVLQASREQMQTIAGNQETVKAQLDEINMRIMNQQRDLAELSLWLGTYELDAQKTITLPRSQNCAQPVRSVTEQFAGLPLRYPNEADVETLVASSPLLLAFRRILLRDLSDRISHATDIHVKDVGMAVSALKEGLTNSATPEHVSGLFRSQKTFATDTVMEDINRRLRAVEATYVRREENSSSDKPNSISLGLPTLREEMGTPLLAKQLQRRIEDLEERIAYFESERAEFRKIVRSLIEIHHSGLPSATSLDQAANTAVLRDFMVPPSQAQRGVQSTVTPSPPPTGTDGSGKQIYRVVGLPLSAVATPAPSPAQGTFAVVTRNTLSTPSPQQTPELKGSVTCVDRESPSLSGRSGVGSTHRSSSRPVVRDVIRYQVSALPPLPYEMEHQ